MNRLHPSLRWSIAVALVALFIAGARVLWPFLTPLALALLLTYMLVPLVNRIERNTGWPRTGATAFVYVWLLLGLVLIPLLVVPVVVEQVQALEPILTSGIEEIGQTIEARGSWTILGQRLNLFQLYQGVSDQLLALTTSLASVSLEVALGLASTFVSTVVWLLLILVISFYVVRDSPNIASYFWSLIPREHRVETYYLTQRLNRTWNAFLRGQLLLCTAIFVATTVVLLVLGVPQALFLGILAGLMNLIPNLGPVLSAIPAILLALVQGPSHFEMSNLLFALLVAGAYTLIQQLEINILVPRIIGSSVQLHPAMVLLGTIIGFSTIGLLGIFLAAPLLASIRVIGGYAYRKLLDPTFEPPGIVLPPELVAISDPRERPVSPLRTPSESPTLSPWRQWVARVRR